MPKLHVHCWQLWCDCHKHMCEVQQRPSSRKIVKSYGIIAFSNHQQNDGGEIAFRERLLCRQQTLKVKKERAVKDPTLGDTSTDQLKVLLIQRRHTNAFSDILLGRYDVGEVEEHRDHLITLLSELTCSERSIILDCNAYDEISLDLPTLTRTRRVILRRLFCQNRVLLCSLIASLNPYFLSYSSCEYGFPKGRRERETNMVCALREFCEETGYKNSQIEILNSETTIDETFIGSDGKHYVHSYYLARVNDPLNPNIPRMYNNEVKTVGWYSIPDAYTKLKARPYDVTKCQVLATAHDLSKPYFTLMA